MADVVIWLPETGLDLVARVYDGNGLEITISPIDMTESQNYYYTGDYSVAGLASGTYAEFTVAFLASGIVKGDGILKVNNGVEVTDGTLASQTSVNEVLVDTSTTLPAQISGLNNLSAAQVNAEVDQALADYDAPTKTEMDSAFTQIKGATWSGTDTLEAIKDAVDTKASQASVDIIDNNVDTILTDTSADIPALINALNNLSQADIVIALGSYGATTLTDLTSAFTAIKGPGWTATDTLEALRDAIDTKASQTSVNTIDTNVDSILEDTATTIPALIDALPTAGENADAVWDEVLTGSLHNDPQSAGKRLRQLASQVVHSGTAQGSGTGNNQIRLDAGASSTNGVYDPALISIINGTGAGQTRLIIDYVGGVTQIATVDRDWRTNPSTDSEFIIYADAGRNHVNEGLAQGGAASSITLNANASAEDDAYNNQLVFIRSGHGADQVRVITDYNGDTKVATVDTPWVGGLEPNTTSGYVLIPEHVHLVSEIQVGLATQASVDVIDGNVDAIKAKTDSLPADPASNTVVNTRASQSSLDALNDFNPAIDQVIVATNNDKTGYGLSSSERTDLAGVIEAALLADGDGRALINAIVTAIGNLNVDEIALVAAIRADLERTNGKLYNIETKTNNLPTDTALDLSINNVGVQKASKLIPHNVDLT